MGYDVFISYRRNGGEQTAKMIRDNLVDLGYNVFFDVESMRSGNFNTKLYSVIDECTDFILVLSPNALERCVNEDDWVRREVEYALSKNKNVVPILLRGFKFDSELPESMKMLPQMNGIEASTEFFDAFLNKLQKFLKTKPTVIKRFSQNSLVRKTVPLVVALTLILGVVFGIKLVSDYFLSSYPRTKAEKSLTQEVIYCVGNNLTNLEIIADGAFDAIEAVERHFQADSKDFGKLNDSLEVCRQSIDSVDESFGLPDGGFVDRLAESPFSSVDIVAMNGEVAAFKAEWLDKIDYLEFVASDICVFSKVTKLEIADNYKKYLEETLDMYACLTNMIFVGVTDKNSLENLHAEILPDLNCIPLNSQNWSTDLNVLKHKEKEQVNKLNSIVNDISVLTGNINVESHSATATTEVSIPSTAKVTTTKASTSKAATAKVTTTQAATLSPEDYSKYMELVSLQNQIREECLPEEGDSWDTLWVKMTHLLANGFYDDARDCADACRAIDTDPNAKVYMKSLDCFIDLMETEGVMHGCLITGYYEPDGINELIEIGDIIVSVNGEPTRNYEEYTEKKSQVATENFDLVVLRLNDDGEFEKITLDAYISMPRFYIYEIVYLQET